MLPHVELPLHCCHVQAGMTRHGLPDPQPQPSSSAALSDAACSLLSLEGTGGFRAHIKYPTISYAAMLSGLNCTPPWPSCRPAVQTVRPLMLQLCVRKSLHVSLRSANPCACAHPSVSLHACPCARAEMHAHALSLTLRLIKKPTFFEPLPSTRAPSHLPPKPLQQIPPALAHTEQISLRCVPAPCCSCAAAAAAAKGDRWGGDAAPLPSSTRLSLFVPARPRPSLPLPLRGLWWLKLGDASGLPPFRLASLLTSMRSTS